MVHVWHTPFAQKNAEKLKSIFKDDFTKEEEHEAHEVSNTDSETRKGKHGKFPKSKSNGDNFVPAPTKKYKKESYQQIKDRKMTLVSELKNNWNSIRPKAATDNNRTELILKMMSLHLDFT